jgi:hypothetical protein
MAEIEKKMGVDEQKRWRELYSLAGRIDELNPWQWMDVADCFGISLPDMQEPCFVTYNGEPGKLRSVRMLLGWKALYDFMTKISDKASDGDPWLLEIRMIELVFVNDVMIFKHEQEFLDSMRIKVGAEFKTPVFRSIVPGYHPWLPDRSEIELISTALYQAYGMAMRVESDALLLKEHLPRQVLIRRKDDACDWQEEWVPMQQIADEEVEVSIASSLLGALSKRPLLPAVVQIDLAFIPMTIQPGGQRPQTTYLLLVVDANNGMILSGEIMQAMEGIAAMWGQVPVRLLTIFKKLGGCPEVIEIKSDRMANILRPLEEFLPFKMVRRERLNMLTKAYESLGEHITSGEQQD